MRLIGLAGAALALVVLGCSSSSTSPSNGGGHTASITLRNIAFSPGVDTVAVNTTLTWTNGDGVTHNVTYGSGPGSAFASANLTNGQAYTHQFAAAGTYVVYCTIHGSPTSGMRATVVVQ